MTFDISESSNQAIVSSSGLAKRCDAIAMDQSKSHLYIGHGYLGISRYTFNNAGFPSLELQSPEPGNFIIIYVIF